MDLIILVEPLHHLLISCCMRYIHIENEWFFKVAFCVAFKDEPLQISVNIGNNAFKKARKEIVQVFPLIHNFAKKCV